LHRKENILGRKKMLILRLSGSPYFPLPSLRAARLSIQGVLLRCGRRVSYLLTWSIEAKDIYRRQREFLSRFVGGLKGGKSGLLDIDAAPQLLAPCFPAPRRGTPHDAAARRTTPTERRLPPCIPAAPVRLRTFALASELWRTAYKSPLKGKPPSFFFLAEDNCFLTASFSSYEINLQSAILNLKLALVSDTPMFWLPSLGCDHDFRCVRRGQFGFAEFYWKERGGRFG